MTAMIMISCKDNDRFPYKTKKSLNDLNLARQLTDKWADRHTNLWRLRTNLKTAFQ